MLTAIVLCSAARGRVQETAQDVLAIDEVSEVYSVAGDWDLVAMIRVRHSDDLADVVTRKLGAVEGLLDTTTLIAFRAYSNHDLDRLFSEGNEERRGPRTDAQD